MTDCCEVRSDVPAGQRRLLWTVLAINAAMFLAESVGGLLASSTALLADSADMLGDAIVYGVSLWAVARGPAWRARAALLKGLVMAGFALAVLGEVAAKLVHGWAPSAPIMVGLGSVALGANALCLALLWRRRGDDVNMRSAWMCSLNDVAGNAGVLIAAAAVAASGAGWPDVAVGLAIGALFGASAVSVIRAARRALRTPEVIPV